MKLASQKSCQTCGGTLDLEAPSGFCPACLLTTALEIEEHIPSGSRIEDYELLDEVARGGMGIVYRARQRAPTRVVALKMILPAHLNSSGAVNRFRAEAEAAASLEHEGILPIYAVGEHDGAPFYSMKFAEGGTLSARIEKYRDQPQEAAALMARLARAVAYAHEQGILHRDLKPANILFDAADKPYVSDFGLAKWLQRESDLTQTLAILGTPFYMAPEQATDSHKVTAAADVYSLGAILYHLLVGGPPVSGETPMEILHQAATQTPTRPRLTNRHIPPDLETICLKCLEKEPAERYATASDLAEDLERFGDGRTILARPAGLTKRAWRWTRRNPVVASLALLCVAAVSALTATFLFFLPQAPSPAGGEIPALATVEKSIAVLPFANLSGEKENDSFAAGVQEEVLTDLASIADLKVISRSSVIRYAPNENRDLHAIGRALGVAYVLEGSVQRSGASVRVSAQLLDTRTNALSWAESYDRDLADVFAIQTDISQQITSALQVKLSPQERSLIKESPTKDIVAFDLYSRAKTLRLTTSFGPEFKDRFLQVAELLNQAVARDPSFLPAWCELARVHGLLYFAGYDHTPARLILADNAVQTALRLRPDSGEAHLTLARHLYQAYRDYDRARIELATARRTLPNNAEVFALDAYMDRRQERWEESTRKLERAIELDPQNPFALGQIAMNYSFLRHYEKAAAVLDRALAIEPEGALIRIARAWVDFEWRADSRPLHATIDAILAEDPAAARTVAADWLFLALCERDFAAADRALAALSSDEAFTLGHLFLSRAFAKGFLARVRGDAAGAHAAFTSARIQQAAAVQAQPESAAALCVLGLIDAGLGQKEEALREGRRAMELLPLQEDGSAGTDLMIAFAIICAWTGEQDLACNNLASAAEKPCLINYGQLKLQPWWDPLRGNPRFEKIVSSFAPKTGP